MAGEGRKSEGWEDLSQLGVPLEVVDGGVAAGSGEKQGEPLEQNR